MVYNYHLHLINVSSCFAAFSVLAGWLWTYHTWNKYNSINKRNACNIGS